MMINICVLQSTIIQLICIYNASNFVFTFTDSYPPYCIVVFLFIYNMKQNIALPNTPHHDFEVIVNQLLHDFVLF